MAGAMTESASVGRDPEGEERSASQRAYWRFYWPLVLMSLAMVVARQFQNKALASFDDAERELAVFAYASSVYWVFNAVLAFIPQMANVLGRSGRSRRLCLSFTAAACLLLTAPLVFLGFTPAGRVILARIFEIKGDVLEDVARYLRFLAPLVLLNGLRHYYIGLLVQSKRTGVVAALNVLYVGLVLAMLLVGRRCGWGPVVTLVLMQAVPLGVQLAGSWAAYRLCYRRPPEGGEEDLSYRKALEFFWPVALTGLMFSLTRPIIYSFVGRTENPQPVVAALRVGFDLAMLFQMSANQFRHVFVTFGNRDLPGLRRFMFKMVMAASGLMLLTAATPLKTLFFGEALGIEEPVLGMAGHVLLVLCPVPLVIAWRNYYHGLALTHHRTLGMGIGGMSRNVATYLVATGLLALGLFNHVAAAAVLVCGFSAEALTVTLSTWSWRRKGLKRQ